VASALLTGTGLDEQQLSLAVSGTGAGQVTAAFTSGGMRDGGVPSCSSGTCAFPVRRGSALTLSATPAASSDFVQWFGDCSGDGGCALTMLQPHAVGAQLDLKRLALTVTVTGSGRVKSSPAGLDCAATSGTCSASFPYGTQVSLVSLPFRSALTSSTGCGASGTNPCVVNLTAPTSASFTFSPVNVAYLTSFGAQWSLYNLATFDALCAAGAVDGGLVTTAPAGSWVAYLSDSNGSVSAASRIGSKGWVLPDGRLITTGSPYGVRLDNPILVDEHQNLLPLGSNPRPMTASTTTGALYSGEDCGGFSGGGIIATGAADSVSSTWSSTSYATCSGSGASAASFLMYCFQVSNSASPARPVVPPGGRFAFVSRTTFPVLTATPVVDATCTAEARDAGLPGDYVALRALSNQKMADRLDAGVGLWYLPNGEPVMRSWTEFLANKVPTPITVLADGTLQSTATTVWTGASSPSQVSNDWQTCANWGDSTFSVYAGSTAALNTTWFNGVTTAPCTTTTQGAVYCFQQ
jgi:hypothetical protein